MGELEQRLRRLAELQPGHAQVLVGAADAIAVLDAELEENIRRLDDVATVIRTSVAGRDQPRTYLRWTPALVSEVLAVRKAEGAPGVAKRFDVSLRQANRLIKRALAEVA